ncbi:hypothetical protein [Leptospira ilyithenensis]|uniref:hypothetical protein n=1 Tax=Leptospira ilyithenensis TaxID=2484901 RepID=UPI001AEF46FD
MKVSTPSDPVSSKKNESFYSFYQRTVIGSYLSAWSLKRKQLVNGGYEKILPIHSWNQNYLVPPFLERWK